MCMRRSTQRTSYVTLRGHASTHPGAGRTSLAKRTSLVHAAACLGGGAANDHKPDFLAQRRSSVPGQSVHWQYINYFCTSAVQLLRTGHRRHSTSCDAAGTCIGTPAFGAYKTQDW
ncbi:hypothetical protein FKP32DRAFT_846699 [Trametes sanguinea]|nr:hypothetical protein FKP32DRAFT_846699 [Trametes sanguinea]